MLRGVHVSSDLPSLNSAPDISATEKLHIIATTPIAIIHHSAYEFDLRLPYIRDTAFTHSLPSMVGSLALERIDLGDEELYGHGIGSRLLTTATRFAVGLSSVTALTVDDHPRLGVLNTVISVFGEENVEARIGDISYGGQGEHTLGQIFDDHPVQEGEPYLLSVITARIDPATAMTWEVPIE
jgi:hypothetical protein